ncbi:YqzL family protein [Sporolactobacillus sp. THM7-7]|nr:YqzL family protein [Sporolactobacillus sp. THM7-7]
MLNLTWRVFCMTGSIDSYLLLKELEQDEEQNKEVQETASAAEEEPAR